MKIVTKQRALLIECIYYELAAKIICLEGQPLVPFPKLVHML